MTDTERHDQELYVGLDLGTSGLKAVAAGPGGDLQPNPRRTALWDKLWETHEHTRLTTGRLA